MTEDRLKELLVTSENNDSFDSAIARELFVEFDRLRSVLAEPDSPKLIASLTMTLNLESKETAELERRLRNEPAKMEGRLRNELAEMKGRYRTAKETIDKQNRRINLIKGLLNSCLDHIRRLETAEYIRKKLPSS